MSLTLRAVCLLGSVYVHENYAERRPLVPCLPTGFIADRCRVALYFYYANARACKLIVGPLVSNRRIVG